jgi:hypothetical protein
MYSLEHDIWIMSFKFEIFIGFTLLKDYFFAYDVPRYLNFVCECYKPQIYTSPLSVNAHICSYPHVTFIIFSLSISTYLGNNTFKFGGWCPIIPLRFFPHVYNFPSIVIPADIDFLASISMKLLTPLMSWGKDMLVYEPRPS